ncbi:ABC transporter ATP-binding protein [Azorhizobium doebereinerae]|uniref:ABC transporter ATP-binding protein n=1 Tax=Azorhizobium doebereinerae TaxID=281091 RepID=UPI0003FDE1B7|nr:ABC transporter ATP-binding protein [Azorhizobium doebereinerae]
MLARSSTSGIAPMTDPAPAFLALDGLSKRYADHVAVDALTLGVAQGEFISLLGPSGCGKTTTLQMIAGFTEPSGGAIRLEGRDLVAVKPARRGLGIVFQSYALFPHMTAAENVAFGLEMQRVPKAERARRVTDALALVGLSALAERYPRRMSGGQQQRVALARALVIQPRILLLDEPLSNLDAKLREEMQIELRQIQRRIGTTTILVTHDQHEAMALSDRIVVMNAGKVEQIGRPQDVYERPATPFVASFLGKTNVFEALVERGADGAAAVLGTVRCPCPPHLAGAGHVLLTVRPEKIAFADEGLACRIVSRVFQGTYWLFIGETPAGVATIVCQNDGAAQPGEGESVHLTWRADDAALRPLSGAGA